MREQITIIQTRLAIANNELPFDQDETEYHKSPPRDIQPLTLLNEDGADIRPLMSLNLRPTYNRNLNERYTSIVKRHKDLQQRGPFALVVRRRVKLYGMRSYGSKGQTVSRTYAPSVWQLSEYWSRTLELQTS